MIKPRLPISLVCSAWLLLGLAPPLAAGQIAGDGSVHRIDVEPHGAGSKSTGTALRHVRQLPGGGSVSALVPGTDDAAVDRDPATAIDPVTGGAVVVWSREHAGGMDLFAAVWNSAGWSQPRPLLAPDPDRTAPQIRIGRSLVHVFWLRRTPAGVMPQRAAFDRATLERRFGPETLPLGTLSAVPHDGTEDPTAEPSPDDHFFSGVFAAPLPGEPGQVVVWGIRDEPVPFGYCQAFGVRDGLRGDMKAEAAWVHERFTLWLEGEGAVVYTSRRNGAWIGFRVVETSADFPASAAKSALFDALGR